MYRNGRPAAAWILSALFTGGLAMLPATLISESALARDNCPRLPSASLVIVIPEGGCDQADPAKQPAVPEVTVIRGGPAAIRVDRSTTGAVASNYTGSGPVIIVVRKSIRVEAGSRDAGAVSGGRHDCNIAVSGIDAKQNVALASCSEKSR